MAVVGVEQAEIAFNAHNWEDDAAWKSKLSQVFISNAADQNLALMRLKRKYFKSEIDSNLSLDSPKDNSTKLANTPEQTSNNAFDFGRRLRISANYACLFLHAFNLLAVLGYLFIFGSIQASSFCFRSMMLSSIFVSLLQIPVKYGRPKLNISYAQLVLSDEQCHFILMHFSMIFSQPMFLAIVPVCVRSILFLSMCLDKAILPFFLPQYHQKMLPYLSAIQEKQIYLSDFLSQLDVAMGFVLLISMLSSARQPMVVLLFWQYLRIRYMFSSSGKAALQNAGRTLDSYLLHPRSPLLIQKVWLKVKEAAYSTVDLDQARSRAHQFQNAKCTIM